MTTNLFDPQNTTTEETPAVDGSYAEALVGDGKKFKDIEALARGKFESDTVFIPQLQKENAALRNRTQELEKQLQERITLEEFMNELKTPGQPDDDVTNHQPQDTNVNAPSIKPDDIGKIIDERLQEQRKREQTQANLNTVATTLANTWGPQWQQKLADRAKELSLSHEFLDDVAKRSPQAFLQVVLPQAKAQVDPNTDIPPRSQISRTTPVQEVGARNKAYYDKLKQTNPKVYYSESVTQQRHRDAQRLGEAFFQN